MRIFTNWYKYLLDFRFGASPKKLFVSCYYHILFTYLAAIVFKVNTTNIQYFWVFLEIQIKYVAEIQSLVF